MTRGVLLSANFTAFHTQRRACMRPRPVCSRRCPKRQVVCAFLLTIWYTFLSPSNPDAHPACISARSCGMCARASTRDRGRVND